jgi:subtilisin family serine protease
MRMSSTRHPRRRFGAPPILIGASLLLLCGLSDIGRALAAAPAEPIPSLLERAAQDPRIDPRLAARLEGGGGLVGKDAGTEAGYGVPVLLRGHLRRADLERLGVVVSTVAGGITTAQVPPGAFEALLSVPGLEGIEAATNLDLLLTVSAPETGADDCWGDIVSPYNPPYPGTTGAGVVVGIIDTGIDLAHADFRNASNQTRIKYLWDQTRVGTKPAGFTYGAEWTETQINQGVTTETDSDGHGTHIAGIAAGNGRATGLSFPNYRYVGIAPEADIVVVKSYLTDDKVIDGVNYVFQKAAVLGKDAVALVAVGNNRGGHDGSHYLDTAISALTGPGRLVVAACGNSAGLPIHASANLGSGQSATINVNIPSHVPNAGINEYVEIEGWHNPTASFRVKLTSPGGFTTNWVNPGTGSSTITGSDGAFFVQNGLETNSKGGKKVRVYMFESGTYTPRVGTWQLVVERVTPSTTGVFDAWVSDWYLDAGALIVSFTSNVDLNKLVMSPATGDSVIAVGAYTTKTQWLNVSGGTSFYVGAPPLGQIADFTSPGPRRDGVQRPDLCGPGYGVMAALSATVAGSTSNTWKAEDGVHRIRKGTSAAAAHVAGALALLLEEQPRLTPSQARNLLITRAVDDAWTGTVPSAPWGYGKLSVLPPLGTAVDSGPAPVIGMTAFPNPTRGVIRFDFALTADDVAAATKGVAVRILDVQGRHVATVAGSGAIGSQSVTWSGLGANGKEAPPGVYLARLEAGGREEVWKFVRMK